MSLAMDNVEIFKTDAGITAFQYLWKHYARTSHMRGLLGYIIFLSLYSIATYTYQNLQDQGTEVARWSSVGIQVLVLINVAWYVLEEVQQYKLRNPTFNKTFKSRIDSILRHFRDNVWNVWDILSYATISAGISFRLAYGFETVTSRCLLAIGSLVTWFKVLGFIYPFSFS